jgi:predicted nucleic acid-binding protein
VHNALSSNFPHTRFLSEQGAGILRRDLVELGITGGAVYDALVGATAIEHGLPLATLDRRALATYRALGVELRLIGDL